MIDRKFVRVLVASLMFLFLIFAWAFSSVPLQALLGVGESWWTVISMMVGGLTVIASYWFFLHLDDIAHHRQRQLERRERHDRFQLEMDQRHEQWTDELQDMRLRKGKEQ